MDPILSGAYGQADVAHVRANRPAAPADLLSYQSGLCAFLATTFWKWAINPEDSSTRILSLTTAIGPNWLSFAGCETHPGLQVLASKALHMVARRG